MNVQGQAAVVTGAGSGLGEAVARALAAAGARVALLDIDLDRAERVAANLREQGLQALACRCDISDADGAAAALDAAAAAHGPARVLMNIAGVGGARRVIQRDGTPAPLADFERTLRINLLGTYNMVRLMAARAATLPPQADDERGVIVNTASVAAFDGQVGQEAYAASKAGVVGMTLPLARDLAQWGIRVCTIAPGIFATPLLKELPEPVQQSLAESIPFPKRLGHPDEFAALALHIAANGHLNGEVIRLDGALRMAPR
ncbi:MAG TPA: SDR family NAD(P)-dependent oxidoreductase [Burkholderiaceae bacterium]|nr:SDR family NAD(P)-dependent oxidoreductase [Burkholderiaceae bacterium]